MIKKKAPSKRKNTLIWRKHLSEYEQDFFLPELKGRCEELLKCFQEIDLYCEEHQNDENYGATLRKLMLDPEIEKLVPASDRPPSNLVLANNYFQSIREMNKDNFIQPLKDVIDLFKEDVSLKDFGNILNQVNHVCATVIQLKEQLFFYSLKSIVVAHDLHTKQPIFSEPKELKMILIPFQVKIENIYSIANSTSGSIQHWHKQQMEWQTNQLKIVTEKIARQNNLLTIFVAIIISITFLILADPYENIKNNIKIDKLEKIVTKLENEKEEISAKLNKSLNLQNK